mgnify:CR=1 FL=1
MNPPGAVFRTVSAINAWSLLLVGGLSLFGTIVMASLAGALVSLAVAIHGALELSFRRRILNEDGSSAANWMALNQLGLATTLSLYFAYQVMILDGEAVSATLMASPLADVLLIYPEPMRSQLVEMLPFLIGIFYAIAAGVSWLVCGVTALFYWMQRTRSDRPN